jgi:hypothetical protein
LLRDGAQLTGERVHHGVRAQTFPEIGKYAKVIEYKRT